MENRETKAWGENRILFMLEWNFFHFSEKLNFIYFLYIKRFGNIQATLR